MAIHGDLRDQMRPSIAKAVPNSPEAITILNGDYFKPMTFGGLVTQLVETGAVEVGDIETVRAATCELVGIEPAEFDERLGSPDLIEDHTAGSWAQDYRIRAKNRLIGAKQDESMSHFSDTVFAGLEGQGAEKLGTMIAEQRELVQRREGAIRDHDSSGRPALAISDQMRLDNLDRPALNDLEASGFAVPLADILKALKDDAWFNANGSDFTAGVLNNFVALSEILKEDAILYEGDLPELYEGTSDDPRVLEAAHCCWLQLAFRKDFSEESPSSNSSQS